MVLVEVILRGIIVIHEDIPFPPWVSEYVHAESMWPDKMYDNFYSRMGSMFAGAYAGVCFLEQVSLI